MKQNDNAAKTNTRLAIARASLAAAVAEGLILAQKQLEKEIAELEALEASRRTEAKNEKR